MSNILYGEHPAANNAGIWLRDHLHIPSHLSIVDEYEKYFNCRVDIDDRVDSWMMPNKIVFASNADLTAFLLRWS